jgi:hypothetical protein
VRSLINDLVITGCRLSRGICKFVPPRLYVPLENVPSIDGTFPHNRPCRGNNRQRKQSATRDSRARELSSWKVIGAEARFARWRTITTERRDQRRNWLDERCPTTTSLGDYVFRVSPTHAYVSPAHRGDYHPFGKKGRREPRGGNRQGNSARIVAVSPCLTFLDNAIHR